MQGKSGLLWTGVVAHSVEVLFIMFVLSHITIQNKRIEIKMKFGKQFDFYRQFHVSDVWSGTYIDNVHYLFVLDTQGEH